MPLETSGSESETGGAARDGSRHCRLRRRVGDLPKGSQRAPHLERPWPVLDDTALLGLAGEVVATISPHSEADPVALLVQFLAAVGNIVGRHCYYQVEGDRHHPNLFITLVGQSSKSRKGTSWGRVCSVAKLADLGWAETRRKGGLSSGEGLINEVRDPLVVWDKKNKIWDESDPGVSDKRMMVIEPEFAGALAVMERHGNTLSMLIRKAWDGDKLQTMTRSSPLSSTGAHISIIAHITEAELRARLWTDAANGFANRFMFPLVRRARELPFGGALSERDIIVLGERLKDVIDAQPTQQRITKDDEKRGSCGRASTAGCHPTDPVWSAPSPPGLRRKPSDWRWSTPSSTARGRYIAHLTAGLAVWDYCQQSAGRIFADASGIPSSTPLSRPSVTPPPTVSPERTSEICSAGMKVARASTPPWVNCSVRAKPAVSCSRQGGRPTETWFTTCDKSDESDRRGANGRAA